MHKAMLFVGILTAALAVSGPSASAQGQAPQGAGQGAAAQDQNKPQAQPREPQAARGEGEQRGGAFGNVASVGVDRFELKRRDGTSVTVIVDDQTRFREGEKEIHLEDLKPGDNVMVRGRENADKQIVAMGVRRATPEEMERFRNTNRTGGEILSIEGNQIKVRSPWQGERTITVTDQTQFMKQGQPASLKDLKVGDRIFAAGKEADGKFTAERVFIGPFERRGEGRRGEQQPQGPGEQH